MATSLRQPLLSTFEEQSTVCHSRQNIMCSLNIEFARIVLCGVIHGGSDQFRHELDDVDVPVDKYIRFFRNNLQSSDWGVLMAQRNNDHRPNPNLVTLDYFDAYKLRLPHSARFAEYAIDHLKQQLGTKMLVDFNEASVTQYQNARLSERAAPKSVNEEVGFLLRILGDLGDLIRIRLRKKKMLKLKVRQTVGRTYTLAEKDRMLAVARRARSPHIYPALALALNAGMRDAEGPGPSTGGE